MKPAAFVLALAVTALARAAPDIVGGPFGRERGGENLPVAPVVATSVLAGIVAWVLALLRRRKSKAKATGSAPGANP